MHATSLRAVGVGSVLFLFALTAIPHRATGHEHEWTDPYEFIVGWRAEPPFVGVLNGLDLEILRNVTGGGQEPVEGVAENLTATLMTGGSSAIRPLEGQFDRPGWYTFDVIPTREGTYSVRIQGTIGTSAVDFTTPLGTVTVRGDIEFPVTDPTPQDLRAENEALRSQTTLAIAIGALGLVMGVVSLAVAVRATRKRDLKP